MRRIVWLSALCVVSWCGMASATSFVLSGSCDGTQASLRLHAQDHGDKPEVVGFHVYRTPIAIACRTAERVTPQPIPREDRTEYEISLFDEKAQAGLAYEYTLVGVDEEGREHDLPYALPAWVGCGDAPVAHGFVEDVGWALIVEPACAVHCNPAAPVSEWPPDIDAWVGRRIPVLLYGSVGWKDAVGPTIAVSDWELESCTVSVVQRPWGLVKRLYR